MLWVILAPIFQLSPASGSCLVVLGMTRQPRPTQAPGIERIGEQIAESVSPANHQSCFRMGGPSSESDFAIPGIVGAHKCIDSFLRKIKRAGKREELQDGVAYRLHRVEHSQSPGGNSRLIEIEEIGRRGRRKSQVLGINHIEQPDAVGFAPGNKLPAEPQFQPIRGGDPERLPRDRTVLVIVGED